MKRYIAILFTILLSISTFTACGSSGSSASKHELSYVSGEIRTINDYELACVYTEYTNNSGETALPADYVNVKAFQNGKEIPIIVFTGTKVDEYIQCDTAVQSGTTAKVIWTFQPEDKSPVTVELSTGAKHTIDN